ncbi:MAG: hypothetical protein IT262_14510 [Saprospiraceae bacterium]|nr:hypothetical protein [Saprospiraceae bacterium]
MGGHLSLAGTCNDGQGGSLYAQVCPTLSTHTTGYPTADHLRSLIRVFEY